MRWDTTEESGGIGTLDGFQMHPAPPSEQDAPNRRERKQVPDLGPSVPQA